MGNKFHYFGLAGIAVLAVCFLFSGIDAPWKYYRDSNGHLQERISENYRRHGILGLRLGPAVEVVSPELEPVLKIKYENSFYFYQKGNAAYLLHHPPTLHLLIYASTRIFGNNPGAARLPMVLLVFATAVLIYLMAGRLFGRNVALGAAFFWTLNPLVLCFGRMLDHVPFCEFFITLGTWQYLRWKDKPNAKNLVLLIVFLWAGGLSSWYAYFLSPVLFLHHLLMRRDGDTFRLFVAVAFSVVGALGMLAVYYVWLVGADGLRELLQAFFVRSGRALEVGGTRIPIPFFNYLLLELHRIPFFFTPVAGLLVLGALWAWWRRPVARVTREQGEFLLLVLAPAVLILLMFRQGAYVHGFHIYFLSIFISVVAGWALVRMLQSRAVIKVAAILLMAYFPISAIDVYRESAQHLRFDIAAKGFAEVVDAVSDEETVVGQSLLDEPTMWWLSGTNRMTIQREATPEQIKKIIEILPDGYRFIYMVYLSQPNEGHELDQLTSFLYRNYDSRILKNWRFSSRGIIIFDTSKSRPEPRLDEKLGSLPHAYFPDEGLLFVSSKPPEKAGYGDTIEFENIYISRRPLKNDYTLLWRLSGAGFLISHEPAHGMLPTSFWDSETVSETMYVNIDMPIPSGEYEVQIAMCSQNTLGCLEPEKRFAGIGYSEIPWTAICRIQIEADSNQPAMHENRRISESEPTLQEIFVLSNVEKMREFVMETWSSGSLASDVYGLYDYDKRKVIFSPIKTQMASDWFNRSSFIEKMVPSAMQDFMAQQKFRLIGHYVKEKRYFRALREFYGILLHTSNSYEYSLRAFKYFSEKSWGGFLADRYAKRLLYMRPGDAATKEILMAQYRKVGRVDAGVKLLGEVERRR